VSGCLKSQLSVIILTKSELRDRKLQREPIANYFIDKLSSADNHNIHPTQ
jgi:hypothetical protein